MVGFFILFLFLTNPWNAVYMYTVDLAVHFKVL